MTYHLDTGAVVAVLRNRPAAVRDRLRLAKSDGASIEVSASVLVELGSGVARGERARENADRRRVFLSGGSDVLPLDEEAAVIAGDRWTRLAAAGTPIGPYDVSIATQAFGAGAALVTADVAEFARLRGLAWQDRSSTA